MHCLQRLYLSSYDAPPGSKITPCNKGSIPLNIHEVWPRPFWGGSSHQNKTPVDHSIGHKPIPFTLLEGDKRPDKINQNPESLNIFCPKQENNV